MLRLIATISKRPDFLPEMSGILDIRIPTYCNYVDTDACLKIHIDTNTGWKTHVDTDNFC